MKKVFFSFVIILVSTLMLRSAPATVSGKVTGGNGMTIRLMTYADQVSFLRKTLLSFRIGEDELFSFSIDISSVTYCWLDLEFQQTELFVQPGQSYVIELELKDQSLTTSYYNRSSLPYKIVKDDDDHLNTSIQDFNQLYNEFLLNNSQKIASGNAKTEYENFIKAIELRFQNTKNPFFLDYIKYKTASMQLFMRLKSRERIGLEYIAGQPVLYENLEYMDFFHLYFEKYFVTYSKYFNYNKTYDLINGTAPVSDFLDSLAADPVLIDIQTRELLLLEGLKELYNSSGFKRDRVLALVNEISANGNSAESRFLADNLIVRLNRLQQGSQAPDFNLVELKTGKNFQLVDFAGKNIYLAFFDSQNTACQSELGMINDIYDVYKTKVAFVAISVDKDLQALAEYLERSGIPWLVLHYQGNLDLLEDYDASTYPHFVYISDKGRIRRCPAPSPSENIRKLFDAN